MFKTIKENTLAEVVEKKSKFIANIFYVESKEEAESMIKEVNKKYHDARHNCYAYRIFTNEGIIEKSSDDGEPSGTAGAPMLNILSKNGLVNILVIVTRYFGGILLGTGGLVRAYSQATNSAIEKAEIIKKELGYELEIILGYSYLENFKYICRKNNIKIIDEKYDENIKLKIEISKKMYEKINEIYSNKNSEIQKIEKIKEKYVEKSVSV